MISTIRVQIKAHRDFSSSDHSLRLIDRCVFPSSLKYLVSLHSHLLSLPRLSSHPSVQNKLILAFSSCGDLLRAPAIFDSSLARNAVCFNVMLHVYVNHGYHSDAVRLFSSMGPDCKPDHYTYPCILKSCSESKDPFLGLQIHLAITRIGLDADIFVGNALIALYLDVGYWVLPIKFLVKSRTKMLSPGILLLLVMLKVV